MLAPLNKGTTMKYTRFEYELHQQLNARTECQRERLRLTSQVGKLSLTPAFLVSVFLLVVIAVTGSIFL